MLAVLRLCNDAFLESAVFPLLEAVQTPPALPQALATLAGKVDDAKVVTLLRKPGLTPAAKGPWKELVHQLLFFDWEQPAAGQKWRCNGDKTSYAGPWDEAFERAMMIELQRFTYWDAGQVQAERSDWLEFPRAEVGLVSLLRGTWDWAPGFDPDKVLGVSGLAPLAPEAECLTASWAFRSAKTLRGWSTQLSGKLNRLLWREAERLKPVEIPETTEILDCWMGKKAQLPRFTVAFSALGPAAQDWVRQLGQLAAAVREAASKDRGLSMQMVEEPVRSEL